MTSWTYWRLAKITVWALALTLTSSMGHLYAANVDQVTQLAKTGRCPGCDLSSADLRKIKLKGADLSGANLAGADLRGVNMTAANLKKANLTGAKIRHANLSEANLTDSDLRRSDLRSADLRHAIIVRADLAKADCSNAQFDGVMISRTNFAGARGVPSELAEQESWKDEPKIVDVQSPSVVDRVWKFLFNW